MAGVPSRVASNPTYLKDYEDEGINPAIDDNDFILAVRIAQVGFDEHQPQIFVGSSWGGGSKYDHPPQRWGMDPEIACQLTYSPVSTD